MTMKLSLLTFIVVLGFLGVYFVRDAEAKKGPKITEKVNNNNCY